jgi:hypothetical protein
VRPLEDSRATGGRSIPSTMQLWPDLLALADLLDLAELVLRKWKGLAETLGLRRPESATA